VSSSLTATSLIREKEKKRNIFGEKVKRNTYHNNGKQFGMGNTIRKKSN